MSYRFRIRASNCGSRSFSSHAPLSGFTLLELLVATSVFMVILMIGMSVLGQASNTWRRSVENAEAFQSARTGFSLITRNLSQATLNTFLDYVDASNRFPPDTGYDKNPVRYARQSNLHFFCGKAGLNSIPGTPGTGSAVFFQFPQGQTEEMARYGGLDGTLNACGYYIEFGPDGQKPGHANKNPIYRYRLKELMAPTEKNWIFEAPTTSGWTPTRWFQKVATDYPDYIYPVAENIIALVIRPEDPADPSLLNDYLYDSRKDVRLTEQPVTANQLPPLVHTTMIAIDEASATRIADGDIAPQVITDALQDRFSSPSDLKEDLDRITGALAEKRINFRVFTTAVPIRESKWTK